MRQRSRIVIITASVAVLGWGYMHIREDQARSRREIDRLSAALAQVHPQRSGATAGVDGERERQALGRAAQVARDQALATLAERDPGGEAQAPSAPSLTFEESEQRVRSAFAAEAVDASWGPNAERTLERIVRSHLPPGSRLDRLACRSTMCEVQLTHADPKAQADFQLTGFQGWPGALFVTEEKQEGGGAVVTIIAAREGTEPPMAPR